MVSSIMLRMARKLRLFNRSDRVHRAVVILLLLALWMADAQAHRDPCHHRHSCPPDQGTYVCGDLGHCDQWPDTSDCQGGKPTPTAQQTPLPMQPPSSSFEETACATVEVCFTPGEDCTARIVKTLGEAKASILLQAYSFTSAPIAKALVDAKKHGVRVEAILDKSNRTDKYSAADFLANSGRVIVGFGELSSSVRVLLDGCPSVEQEPSQQVAARPDEEDGSESSMQCDEHGEARA
jgi:PLD-like domain